MPAARGWRGSEPGSAGDAVAHNRSKCDTACPHHTGTAGCPGQQLWVRALPLVRAPTRWEEPSGFASCVPVAVECCSCSQHPPRAADPGQVAALGTHGSALGMGQVLPRCSLLTVFDAG